MLTEYCTGTECGGSRDIMSHDFRIANPYLFNLHFGLSAIMLGLCAHFSSAAFADSDIYGGMLGAVHCTVVALAIFVTLLLRRTTSLSRATRIQAQFSVAIYPLMTVKTLTSILSLIGDVEAMKEFARNRVANIDRATTSVAFGYLILGLLWALLDLGSDRRRLCAVACLLICSAASSVCVYLLSGEMTWLIAVVRTQTLPVASGFCGVMFTEHALVRPMVEDNVKLREQRAQATESAGDIVNAPMQGAPVAESSPLRAPLVPRAADEPLELEELSESARTVGSSRSSASGPPIPSVFQSLNLVSHYKKEWVEQRVLGVGSFSRAVLIENANTGELAVSKQVFVGHASGKIISDLEREAIALSRLPSHNHIIRYRTCFLRGETLCIVTDYAAGGTLNHLLKQRRRKGSSNVADGSSADAASFSDAKPLAPDTILRWTAQLLSALLTIHASNLMHRDIKPSNIFLSESSDRADLKLGDFGLSRDVTGDGEDDLAQTTCGTPYYMSPEQVC